LFSSAKLKDKELCFSSAKLKDKELCFSSAKLKDKELCFSSAKLKELCSFNVPPHLIFNYRSVHIFNVIF
jgi:hypothetical protein